MLNVYQPTIARGGMNGVHYENEPYDQNEGRPYQGAMVNILTGEPVDQRVPIERRADGLERSSAIAALAEREGISPAEATARYAGSMAAAAEASAPGLTVEAGLAAVINADAEAAAGTVPTPVAVAQSHAAMATV